MEILCVKYTVDEFVKLTENYIDSATAQALYWEFSMRGVFEDKPYITKAGQQFNPWERHLQNSLKMASDQYLQYLRIESVQYDPMVTNYVERQLINITQNKQGGTNTSVVDINENGGNTSTNGGVLTRKNTGTQRSDDSNTVEGFTNDRQINASLPQSITNTGTGKTDRDSAIPSFNWNVASAQAETDNKHKDNSTSNATRTDDLTETTTDGRTVTVTNNRTGKNTNTNTVDLTTDNKADIRERSTGRTGYSPTMLLNEARNYVLSTNAFKWLCEYLNPNFVWYTEL